MSVKNVKDFSEENIKSKEKLEVLIDEKVDFNFIISSIPKGILNDNAFNDSIKKLINRLAYLYNFDDIIMSNLIKDSINEKGLIDENELKKNCKNYYSFENNDTPRLVYKSRNNISVDTKNIKDIKEKLINCFESTTPYDFLKAK